jgi:hypothetical protein
MIDSLFSGGTGKALLVMIGALVGAIIAWLSRIGTRKVQDVKRNIPQ